MKKNKNYIEYDKRIVNSFISLLKTDKAGHITVSKLIKKANITRPTFYLHYKNISDIYNLIEKRLVDKFSNFLNEVFVGYSKNVLKIQLRFAAEIKRNKDFYKSIAKTSRFGEFIQKLSNVCIKTIKEKTKYRKEQFKDNVFAMWENVNMQVMLSSILNLWVMVLRKEIDVDYDFVAYWSADLISRINYPFWKEKGLISEQINYLQEYKKIKKD